MAIERAVDDAHPARARFAIDLEAIGDEVAGTQGEDGNRETEVVIRPASVQQ